MIKRTINQQKLTDLLDKTGLARVSEVTGVSISWLQKAKTGNYKYAPGKLTRNAFCSKLHVNEEDYFPLPTKRRAS